MDNILEIDDVSFKSVVSYEHVGIREGVATFIQGESGCGKSTLLKLCNAYYTPDSGTIRYRGVDIKELDTIELRRKVLLISQQLFLFPGTIEDNFRQMYEYREEPCIDSEEIDKYLKLCEVDFKPDSMCDVMSGGEKQRVFLSIGMSFQPDVLMLDEPTSALDNNTAVAVLTNIKEFCMEQNITLVVISHDNSLTKILADEVITLSVKDRISERS